MIYRISNDDDLMSLYFKSSAEEKIKFILEDYSSFLKKTNALMELLKMDVANDRDFRIKRERGPDNIRVMSSGISDTTAQIAISNVMLDDAFESGDIESEIMKTDEPEKYRRKYHRIISMEQDYKIVSNFIDMLPTYDRYLLEKFYEFRKNGRYINELSDKVEIDPQSLYKRIGRIKKKVTLSALSRFVTKYCQEGQMVG